MTFIDLAELPPNPSLQRTRQERRAAELQYRWAAMLRRFWFSTGDRRGYGVTGKSVDDARLLLRQFGYPRLGESIREVVVDVDIQALDQSHVTMNIGPPSVRGVWYPCHNL